VYQRRSILLVGFIVSLFFIVGHVSAQSNLVANITRTNEYVSGFSNSNYVADLESGHWTVIVNPDSFWDLQVRITVAYDSAYTNVIAESGTDYGNYPRVVFDLASGSTVYIRVSENSVYSDTSGFYRIGVYDDAHIPGFFQSLSFFDLIILLMVLAFLLPLIICIVGARRLRRKGPSFRRSETVLVDAPIHAIPEDSRGSVQTHGTRATTVRLPSVCPSCGAQVSHESVDWVGPLEAQCNYCGATLRASLENI
jgi:hypothetical protein